MPKVSVIVPVYNAERYLRRCIDSILSQTFTDFELILVNDGSADGSGKICDEYAQEDSRVVVIHKENGGVSSARNKGIDVAHGEWISFVDSDDYISTTYLSDFSVNSDCDMMICGMQMFGGENVEHKPAKMETLSGLGYRKYCRNLFDARYKTSPCAKLIKKNILHKNNVVFDTNMKIAEDTLFIMNCLYWCKSIQLIPIVGYYYMSPENIANKYKIDAMTMKYNLVQLNDVANRLSKKIGFDNAIICEHIKLFQYYCFQEYIKSASKDVARKEWRIFRKQKIFNYHPKMNSKELLYLWFKMNFPCL